MLRTLKIRLQQPHRALLILVMCCCPGFGSTLVAGLFVGHALAAAETATSLAAVNPALGGKHSIDENVRVTETDLQELSAPADILFTRHYGEELGLLTESDVPVGYKFMPPFQRSYPVASGDINADGWKDLVFGTDKGVFLFQNMQGKQFKRLPLSIPGKGRRVINTALVDLNNDLLPDLYISLYRGGNHIIFNDKGTFPPENLLTLPVIETTVANSTAFGDLDLDGDIDIVVGNWTSGGWTRRPGETSRNAVFWKGDTGYTVELLPGLPGETQSLLISDINQDGYPDLLVGNDFQVPEFYYMGRAGGKLQLVKRSDKLFPPTTFSTMSIDSGDIDNDLQLEIYSTQASGFTSTNPTNRATMLPLQAITVTCDEYDDNTWKARCLERVKQHGIVFEARQKRNPSQCLEIEEEIGRKNCLAYLLLQKSVRFDKNPELCAQLEKNWADMAYICRQGHKRVSRRGRAQKRETLKQILGRNTLYKPTAEGAYIDLAEDLDVDISGWSWTARFADLDNDEWQDLYVVNGQYPSQKRATKVFFRNQKGQGFTNDTRETGLENYLAISSYTYIDYDNDSDLDIVAVAMDGPIWVYTNNTQEYRGIIFELDDGKANRTGIGSRIIIHYGDNGNKHQMREIKASGGFLSFDAPRAHFGLGDHTVVSRVEVHWSTGEKTAIPGEFKVGHKYKIERVGDQAIAD